MTDNVAIPKTIKQHRYGEVLGTIWREVHCKNGIVSMVFCGKRGKGKSFSMMEWARILDRGPDDIGRFEAKDVRVDPVNFFTDLIGKYPRGKVVCLDDAGLHMYKSDALSDMLKRVSKILQNIRYKHPIIMISLPYFGQLMKDARDMTDLYIEMHRVLLKRKVAVGSLQTLKIAAFSGELFRYNIMQAKETIHDKFRVSVRHYEPMPYYFDPPPADFIRAYEEIKAPTLDRFNQEHLAAIKAKREQAIGTIKEKKMTIPQAVDYCKIRMSEILDSKGKIEPAKIMMMLDKQGEPLFHPAKASFIARVLKGD